MVLPEAQRIVREGAGAAKPFADAADEASKLAAEASGQAAVERERGVGELAKRATPEAAENTAAVTNAAAQSGT